jgi:predicted regulator of Ras-like GTPase activity (Roadblock/LC7/MglB family)
MLSSLFGDLRDLKGNSRDEPALPGQVVASDIGDARAPGFAATSIMESIATEVNDQGQMVDRHLRDLVVTGSSAQAIREHFAATRADLETATRHIALHDPTGVWASAVVKALSDASGRPIERLHLREHTTLRTLAMIERTTLARRDEGLLRIYHADVRAPGADNAAIPIALMERSHMTAVIVGAMQPHAIDGMLNTLYSAVNQPGWRCPTLLFMLPPNGVWIANKIGMIQWPQRLKVQVLNESLSSASAVWNALLGQWNRVKTEPVWGPPPVAALASVQGPDGFPIKVADLDAAAAAAGTSEPVRSSAVLKAPVRAVLDPQRAAHALDAMLQVDGLMGCAVVDTATGLVITHKVREEHPVDIELAAAACTQVLRVHDRHARDMGLSDAVHEIMTSTPTRHHLIRSLSRHSGLFVFALLDKQRSNLALARYKLMEAEQSLS